MDYRADDFTAFLGQKITVSAVDLLDDPVSPEYAEAMCYPGSEVPFECYILVTGRESRLKDFAKGIRSQIDNRVIRCTRQSSL